MVRLYPVSVLETKRNTFCTPDGTHRLDARREAVFVPLALRSILVSDELAATLESFVPAPPLPAWDETHD